VHGTHRRHPGVVRRAHDPRADAALRAGHRGHEDLRTFAGAGAHQPLGRLTADEPGEHPQPPALVERSWVNHDLLGGVDDGPWSPEDPDAEWRQGSELPLADVVRLYEEEAERTRAVFSRIDLGQVRAGDRIRQPVTARWVLQHLIEETARHNGHLDVVRELLDGSTGD
jgi:hypothetical protein